MSYILEALDRAERERRLGRAPGLTDQVGPDRAPLARARRSPPWLWMVMVVNLVLIAALWWLWLERPPPAGEDGTPAQIAAAPPVGRGGPGDLARLGRLGGPPVPQTPAREVPKVLPRPVIEREPAAQEPPPARAQPRPARPPGRPVVAAKAPAGGLDRATDTVSGTSAVPVRPGPGPRSRSPLKPKVPPESALVESPPGAPLSAPLPAGLEGRAAPAPREPTPPIAAPAGPSAPPESLVLEPVSALRLPEAPAEPGPAAAPAIPPEAPEEEARSSSGSSSASDSEEAALPFYRNLTGAERQGLPELQINVHVYSAEPGSRFVIINMRKYREGERLPDGSIRIERITPNGVIVDYGRGRARIWRSGAG